MEIDRRTLLTGLSALGLALASPGGARAAAGGGFLTTARDKLSGKFLLTRVGEDLNIVWEQALPARAHGINLAPGGKTALVAARRPGDFAIVFDTVRGKTAAAIKAAPGRHFYGHAVFTPDGRTLYATENTFESGNGIIGVYDASDGFKRVGEFPTGGVGPHQLDLLADGKTLAVGNGGIRTHPARGREKLNLDTMRSSLTLIDAENGHILNDYGLPDADDRLLSLRHLALDGPRVVIVAQDQATDRKERQLTYVCDTSGRDGLTPLATPAATKPHFNGYCGSVAVDTGTGIVAVSSPRGGTVALWKRTGDGYTWIGETSMDDCCGVGGCIVTSGNGVIRRLDENGRTLDERPHPFRQWDNHLTPLG